MLFFLPCRRLTNVSPGFTPWGALEMPRNRHWGRNGLRRFQVLLLIVGSGFCALLATAQVSTAPDNIDAKHPLVVGYFRGEGVRKQFFVKNLVSQGAISRLDQINYSQGKIAGNLCAIADPNLDLNTTFSADDSVDGTSDPPEMPLRGNFHQLQELKRLYPHTRILISLEGTPDVFVSAAQPASRHAFVASCIQKFIQGKFAEGIEVPGLFDGIDVDWEFPKEEDKLNFIALLGEFRRQLNSAGPNLLLTVAMGDGRMTYAHLDMRAVAYYADEVGIMNYDYAGPWSKLTGLIAPLYSSPGDPEKGGDVDSTIRGYLDMGVPAAKILMGVPFYAYSWNQVAPENTGLFQLGEPVRDDAPYNYIVANLSKFSAYRDPKSNAPWLFDGNTFWTYDDEISISAKLDYAKRQALGGVMIWELSGDTPDGKLLNIISEQIRARTLNDDDNNNDNDDHDADRETP
jgi:chitinase